MRLFYAQAGKKCHIRNTRKWDQTLQLENEGKPALKSLPYTAASADYEKASHRPFEIASTAHSYFGGSHLPEENKSCNMKYSYFRGVEEDIINLLWPDVSSCSYTLSLCNYT